jgi:hypothetical protein
MDRRAPEVIALHRANGYCAPVRRAALLLCLIGCKAEAPPPGAAGPVEAVQEFASAIQRGDAAAAYALLSSRTQRQADEIAARARAVAGDAGGVPESGRQMLFGSALPQGKVEVREISRQGDVAQVEVVDQAHRARTYRVVRERGVWKVDLDLSGTDAGG